MEWLTEVIFRGQGKFPLQQQSQKPTIPASYPQALPIGCPNPKEAPMIPVFDGHNDILYHIGANPGQREAIWLRGEGAWQMDLPRMQQGGFAGGFFAVYIASPTELDAPAALAAMASPPYDLPLPALINADVALPVAMELIGQLMWMERASKGAFKICRSVRDLRDCLKSGTISAVMHFEGAEAIGENLDALYQFHAMGLRSLGPVWSRPTIFGHGVPFAFPSGPNTGLGLTPPGLDLIRACNELRIMVDLSHLNENGFWDVAKTSTAPLVATHSNVNVLCPSSRNLTDRQLHAIRDTGGMVGLNFATCFLRADGLDGEDMTLDPMLRHLDYLLAQLGEDHVGLGSDFDGATVPQGIKDVAGLPVLVRAMQAHGYGPDLMTKLAHENWFALLDRTWGG
jgi:membrane dipeptidase